METRCLRRRQLASVGGQGIRERQGQRPPPRGHLLGGRRRPLRRGDHQAPGQAPQGHPRHSRPQDEGGRDPGAAHPLPDGRRGGCRGRHQARRQVEAPHLHRTVLPCEGDSRCPARTRDRHLHLHRGSILHPRVPALRIRHQRGRREVRRGGEARQAGIPDVLRVQRQRLRR